MHLTDPAKTCERYPALGADAFDHRNHHPLQKHEQRKPAGMQMSYQTLILENVSDAIITTDLDYCVTEWNRAAETIYGWRSDEALGKPVNELLATEFVHHSGAEVLNSFLTKGKWEGEVVQLHKDGTPIIILASVNALRNSDGNVEGYVAVNRDITANRKAEESLNVLSNAIQQTPVSIVITDASGDIEYVNPAFTDITGYTAEEVKGKNPRILKSGQTTADEYAQLWRTILNGGQWQGELHNRAKDGRLFWEYARISPVLNRAGEIAHFIAIKEDITARKEHEREQQALLELAMSIRDSSGRNELLPTLLTGISRLVDAPIVTFNAVDPDSGSVHVEAMYRYAELHTGLHIPLNTPKDAYESVVSRGLPLWTDDMTKMHDMPMVEFAGEERALFCIPLIVQGKTVAVLCLVRSAPFNERDVSLVLAASDMAAVALQRADLLDQALQNAAHLEQEVANRTRELAAANERLQELDRLKTKFVSDVTHELRTPVTNISLYLKLLARKPEKLVDYVDILNEQAERLHILVKDTLDLSKLDFSAKSFKTEPLTINDIVGTIVAANQTRAENHGLELIYRPKRNLPPINGNYDKLHQVITNLVANAINYTPTGSVTVSTSDNRTKQCIEVTVKDTGCGIYPEDIPHLFDRFYRGKRDHMGPVPGTGLGLSIVKEIVDQHGGAIMVKSEVGVGSMFTVSLPKLQQGAAWA